ncbi:hypothetical protein JZ751_000265 [Albula glossodonta]|uniref:Protein Abitram n=1 Tax=Albula glossodonta TaxID=121402 RepID=A0A8T2PVE4_9TELE|nr:hypothetical protein JZ751_000265 [Albula glossodonta]
MTIFLGGIRGSPAIFLTFNGCLSLNIICIGLNLSVLVACWYWKNKHIIGTRTKVRDDTIACAEHKGDPSVIDRYFTRWYKTDLKGKPCEDHCILQHSNRICVITLAESHPILQEDKKIQRISYQISAGCSRLQNKVSGKSKRGGQFLTELAPLCRITSTDGEEYTIFSCIRGRLLEVNEDILTRPNLLLEKPSTEGYIAVILPKFEESKSITEGLLTRAEYEEVVLKRVGSNLQPI